MSGRPLGEQASSLLRLSKQAGCLRSQCNTNNFLSKNILFFLMIRLLTVLLWGFALCQAGAAPAPAEDMRPCDMPDTVSCCQPAAKEACKPGRVKQKVKRTGILDKTEEKRAAKEAEIQRIEQEKKLLRGYIRDNRLAFGELPVLEPQIRDVFLVWLIKLLSFRAPAT